MTIIGGDFNAKLIELNEEEQKIFGKHYLKAAAGRLENTAEITLDNRQRFMDSVVDNDLHICNTHFQKSDQKLCTHKPIATNRENAQWGSKSSNKWIIC